MVSACFRAQIKLTAKATSMNPQYRALSAHFIQLMLLYSEFTSFICQDDSLQLDRVETDCRLHLAALCMH